MTFFQPDHPAAYTFAIIISLLILMVLSVGYYTSRRHDREMTRIMDIMAEEKTEHLLGHLSDRLRFIAGELAEIYRDSPPANQAGHEAKTRHLLRAATFLQTINYISQNRKITYVSPLTANRDVIGLEIKLAAPRQALLKAAATGKPYLSAPFEIVQGGLGYSLMVPGTAGDFYEVVFKAAEAFDDKSLHQHPFGSLPFRIDDNGKSVFQTTGHNKFPADRFEHETTVPGSLLNRTLAVRVLPTTDIIKQTAQPRMLLAPGSLVIILITFLLIIIMLTLHIRERRKTIDEIRIREIQQQAILGNIPDMAWLKDKDSRFIAVNSAFEISCGMESGEIIGKTDFEIWPRDFAEKYRAGDRKVMADGVRQIIDEPLEDGQLGAIWVETIKTPLRDSRGAVVGTAGIARDITERKLTEKKLKHSEAKFRELFDNMSSGVAVYQALDEGKTFKIIDFNRAAERITDATRENILGRDALEVFPDLKKMGLYEVFQRVWKTGIPETHPVSLYQDERILLWAENYVYKLPSGEIVAVFDDITEKKKTEAEINKSRETYRAMFEDSPLALRVEDFSALKTHLAGITATGSDLEKILKDNPATLQECLERIKVVDVNRKSVELFEARDKDELKEKPTGIFESGASQALIMLLNAVAENRPEFEYETVGQTLRGNKRYIKLNWAVMPGHEETFARVLVSINDITEQKRMEEEARLRHLQLIQADKLASLGEVVAGVAHEINNPNNFITYNLPILKKIWAMAEPVLADHAKKSPDWPGRGMEFTDLKQNMAEIIEAIQTGSDRINNVVVNLKDFARQDETLKAEPVRINKMIDKTMTIVGAQARKSVNNIVLNLSDDLPLIMGHFQKLEQVMANLIMNAAHAIPDKKKGRLIISTRYIERLKSVVIEVEDNGVGMDPETMEKIFDPFYTTKKDRGGTGLGLSVSYSLVMEHNAVIGVHSRPGLGTRFTLILPEDPITTKVDLRPTILCVDDEEMYLDMMRTFFGRVDNVEFEGSNSPEGIVAHLEEHPEVDIVISDVNMPGIDGWELLGNIKARFPLLPVILYSGFPDALKNPSAIQPDSTLKKPFTLNQLTETINTIGRQKIWRSSL